MITVLGYLILLLLGRGYALWLCEGYSEIPASWRCGDIVKAPQPTKILGILDLPMLAGFCKALRMSTVYSMLCSCWLP